MASPPVLHGLRDHKGPILLVATFAGGFPGLVGMLNLHGSMVKAGIKHSTLSSKDFTDEWARTKLAEWIESGLSRYFIAHALRPVGAARPIAEVPSWGILELVSCVISPLTMWDDGACHHQLWNSPVRIG